MQAPVEPRRRNCVNAVVLLVHVFSQFLDLSRKFVERRIVVVLRPELLQVLQLALEIILLLL